MYYNTFIIFIFYHLNSNLVRKKKKKRKINQIVVLYLYTTDLMCKEKCRVVGNRCSICSVTSFTCPKNGKIEVKCKLIAILLMFWWTIQKTFLMRWANLGYLHNLVLFVAWVSVSHWELCPHQKLLFWQPGLAGTKHVRVTEAGDTLPIKGLTLRCQAFKNAHQPGGGPGIMQPSSALLT